MSTVPAIIIKHVRFLAMKKLNSAFKRMLTSPVYWSVAILLFATIASIALAYWDWSLVAKYILPEGGWLLALADATFGLLLPKGGLSKNNFGPISDVPRLYYAVYLTIIAAAVLLLLISIGKKNREKKYFSKKKIPEPTAKDRARYNARHYGVYAVVVGIMLAVAVLGVSVLSPIVLHLSDTVTPETSLAALLNTLFTLLVTVAGALIVLAVMYLVSLLVYAVVSLIKGIPVLCRAIARFFSAEAKAQRKRKREAAAIARQQRREEKTLNTAKLKSEALLPVSHLFPGLTKIDLRWEAKSPVPFTEAHTTLEDFCYDLQAYLSQEKQLYYDIKLLRSFVAGMSCSRLLILQGLSGTGKSMLPRMLSEFIVSEAKFSPVQSTWRDRSDLLGYYNDFTKDFKESEFLKDLYEATYHNNINLMVLDEMNLSRIEYYFADFLSTMEFPIDKRYIKVIETRPGQKLPAHLDNGTLRVPTNTWFVGTANTDDSTFTITDKVYDRAFVINFVDRSEPIVTDREAHEAPITADQLQQLFDEACSIDTFCLNDKDMEKFLTLCHFALDTFEINFGNRIMKQIETFVPVFVAAGGTKEEALDMMFATKILRKLEGAYEDYVKEGLQKLLRLVRATYGAGVFTEKEAAITRLTKKLI